MLHLKRRFYEARLTAYEAFCGIAAKYEAPQMRYEAKPFQASCFFAQTCFSGIAFITFRLSRIFGKKHASRGLPSLHSGYPAFLAKKWRLAFLSPPAILNRILSLKTQNFAVK